MIHRIKEILKKLLKILSDLLTILLFAIVLIILIPRITNNKGSFLGIKLYMVRTGSMVPYYNVNDVILTNDRKTKDINIGDDIVYIANEKIEGMNNKLITHRVIDKEEIDGKLFFHTKGIANESEDPLVEESQIQGIVIRKMYTLTFICKILNNIYFIYFGIILPIIIHIFFKILHASAKKRSRKD